MGDVRKDVESLERMNATPKDNLRIMASLTQMVISVNYQRIRSENTHLSKHQQMEKLNEELFYGRRDNPKHR